MRNTIKKILNLIIIFTLVALVIYIPTYNGASQDQGNIISDSAYVKDEWIIKWKEPKYETMLEQVEILDWLSDQNVMRVKLKENVNSQEWLQTWENNPNIEYIQPNYIYQFSQQPNDSHYSKQHYLKQINAEQGWDQVTNTNITVAILDTGVDLSHPDLKSNLVSGINLLDREKPPLDDNGHGTNVAGIIGGSSNNLIGMTGVAWNSQIMPIKVLDKDGKGESFFVGQGIRYAVDNGAKVILLALGDSLNTPFMKEAVEYADSKGVLIVAASGNDGNKLNYPAAFPNVLSVGAVDSEDNYVPYSNYGQQLDVVAPGEGIFTTKLGGDYMINSGTSMAVPQVAGLAALIFHKYPDMTPEEVADLIKFTADDVEDPGWDIKTGYGRINMGTGLTAGRSILKDGFEPNQTWQTAHMFPLEDTFNAYLTNVDTDWYKLNLEYEGKLELKIELNQTLEYGILLEVVTEDQVKEEIIELNNQVDTILIEENIQPPEANQNKEKEENKENKEYEEIIQTKEYETQKYTVKKSQTITIDLPEGTTYIKLSVPPEQQILGNTSIHYSLTNRFKLVNDEYEPNNDPWNAFVIENINKGYIGNFNSDDDSDWYKIRINDTGTLTATVEVDNIRLDPVITIKPFNGIGEVFDYHGSGNDEFGYLHVEPGDYLIKVSDYSGFAVLGEYKLNLRFKSVKGDNNEPNDISTQAIQLNLTDKLYNGKITNSKDFDWYTFTIEEPTYISLDFGAENQTDVYLFNSNYETIMGENGPNWVKGDLFSSGTYYMRISSPIKDNDYTLQAKMIRLYGNFIDIENHWARDTIVKLYEAGLIEGYSNYTFSPNMELTRGELANSLSKALQLPESKSRVNFTDVETGTELYSSILRVYNEDIMNGYEDNSFKPKQAVKRDELVVTLARAFGIPIETDIMPSFYKDVRVGNFGYDEINTFYKLGLLNEYNGENFNSEKAITRAEFVVFLDRLMNLYGNETELQQNIEQLQTEDIIIQ